MRITRKAKASFRKAVEGFRDVIARGHRNLFLIDGNETVFMIDTRFVDEKRSQS
jgi:hypothetical protein